MADKKRNRKNTYPDKVSTYPRRFETFDDTLEQIKQETLSAVVEKEVYPRGRNAEEDEDDTQIYYTPMDKYKKTGRYEHSPDIVAQHMQDRTQFRH